MEQSYSSLQASMSVAPMKVTAADEVTLAAPPAAAAARAASSSATETELQLSVEQQAATQSPTDKVDESNWMTLLISSKIKVLMSSLQLLRQISSLTHVPNAVDASSISSLEFVNVAKASTLKQPKSIPSGQGSDGGSSVLLKERVITSDPAIQLNCWASVNSGEMMNKQRQLITKW